MSGTLLEAERLTVGHGGRALARPVDFALAPGDRLAVVGPSGAGKSTLLRTIARLTPPVAGRLRLEGRAPEELPAPRWRRLALYVPQTPVLRGRTVREAFALAFGLATADRPYDEGRARDGLARLDLAERTLDAPPSDLSVGERQRVALVRALLVEPRVLLLDEPTSALDAANVARVEAWLVEATGRATSRALVLVTHDAAQAARLATHTVTLAAAGGVEP